MARCMADRPVARATERDSIKHISSSETEYLEAAGASGRSKHERVLPINSKWAYAVDGWPCIKRHLISGCIHRVSVIIVATGITSQVYLRAVQRDQRVVTVSAGVYGASGLTVASIKDRESTIRAVAMGHVDGGAIRCQSRLIHTKRVVGDPGHHIMYKVIGQQAAIPAITSVYATFADVEQALIGCHGYSTFARLGNGELFHQCIVIVDVIGINLTIVHRVEPMGSRAATRIGRNGNRYCDPCGLVTLYF